MHTRVSHSTCEHHESLSIAIHCFWGNTRLTRRCRHWYKLDFRALVLKHESRGPRLSRHDHVLPNSERPHSATVASEPTQLREDSHGGESAGTVATAKMLSNSPVSNPSWRQATCGASCTHAQGCGQRTPVVNGCDLRGDRRLSSHEKRSHIGRYTTSTAPYTSRAALRILRSSAFSACRNMYTVPAVCRRAPYCCKGHGITPSRILEGQCRRPRSPPGFPIHSSSLLQ